MLKDQLAVETKIDSRASHLTCGPEGVCEEPITNIRQFNYQGCAVEVSFDVTMCDNGTVIYFEETEEIVDILFGSCTVDESFIEGVYNQAIEDYMQSQIDRAPNCGSNSTLLTSKQINVECQKYCIGPSPVGVTSYYWTPCAEVQSCCIVTREWCLDGEGNVVSGPPSNEQIGECEGFFTGTCYQTPTPIGYNPCITSRCD